MKNNQLKNRLSPVCRLISSVCLGLAMLLLAARAGAAIALQDGSTSINETGSSTATLPVTVTSGASVLVVLVEDKSANPGSEPATISWNGGTLTRAVQEDLNNTTYRGDAIYYCFNPPTGNAVTLTVTVPGASYIELTAYTLSGVDTTVAPLTGGVDSNGGGDTQSFTVNSVVSGSWAGVNATWATTGVTPTITGTGGTAHTTTSTTAQGNATSVTAGYISGLSAGTVTFQGVWTGTAQKVNFAGAVFSPPLNSPPSITVQPQSTMTFSNVTAQLTVTAIGSGLSYQWYSTSSGAGALTAGETLTNEVALSDATKYSGTNTSTLTISNVAASDLTNYAVIITNSYGSVTSSIATLANWPTPVLQLRMPFTNSDAGDPSATTTASDTSGGGIAITMNMFTNGSVAGDLHGAAGTGVTISNPNAMALDMTPNTSPTQSTNQPNDNAGDIVDLLGSTTLTNLGGGNGNITNFVATIWAKLNVPFSGSAGGPRLWTLNAGSTGLDVPATNTLGFQFLNTNQIQFGYSNAKVTVSFPPGNFIVGQWYFFAMTYDGLNYKIYYGTDTSAAQLINTTPASGQTIVLGSSATLAIGNRATDYSRGLNGWLEDFRFYNYPGDSNFVESVRASLAPLEAPIITEQPTPTTVVFPGQPVTFAVTASGLAPLSYQWMRAGTNLIDSANYISGSLSNVLTISGVTTADATNYSVIVTNIDGAVTSSVASLSVVLPNAYEAAVLTNDPFAFYTFSETNNPETGNVEAYDSMGIFNGTYGTGGVNDQYGSGAENGADGIAGPQATADGLIGFPDTNTALGCTYGNFPVDSYVTAPPFNLNNGAGTNILTITAWIKPAGPQAHAVGIVFSRSGSTVAGLDYNATNSDGNLKLGYNWNNDPTTYNWDSGLEPTPGVWSLVALVITPTNATIYVINTNGLQFSVNNYNNAFQRFEGPTLIGNDIQDPTGKRNFNGSIDEVAFFNQALTASQMSALYAAASGVVFSPEPPTITTEPSWPSPIYVGMSASATVTNIGGTSLQWEAGSGGVYTNLTDGPNISGSTGPTLTINSVQLTNALDYIVVVTNSYGVVTSTPPATLTISPSGPPQTYTLDFGGAPIVEAAGSDWNTVNVWNPDGQPASVSVYSNPGSTYTAVVGSRLRTPLTNSAFPGVQLILDGSGVYENDTANPTNVSELRFKSGASAPINYFSSLVLNGGQLDQGVDAIEDIQGTMNVASDSTIYVDSTSTQDRGYQIDSWLTGSGNLFWHQYSGGLGGVDLQITGTSNTFSGQWIVDQGALVGVGANSLGTNNIIVGTNGLAAAVETLYNINDTNASLILGANGEMFLHQNDHFAEVIINGTTLANGTYSFTTLNSLYPGNFPATWTQQTGSTFSTGSGQIVVGNVAVPPSSPHITTIGVSGTTLSFSATNGTPGSSWTLLQSTNVALPLSQWQSNIAGTFGGSGNLSTNLSNTATNLQEFYILKVQ